MTRITAALEEYYQEFRNAGEPEPSPTGY